MKMHFKWTCAALLLALSAGCSTELPSMTQEYQPQQPIASAAGDELPMGAGDVLGTSLFAGDFTGAPTQSGLADIHD
ncbi:MAG TPA: hypothetical protein VFW23_12040 [Tepidisphaeraceae bacterium]|nr:hypothetical protein [Tepidisphaeraceae bacterium]